MNGWRASVSREFTVFAASVATLQGARFLYSLAVASVVSLSEFALWALLAALITYAPALLLGVVNGMAREVPILLGARRSDEATTDEVATWWSGLAAIATIGVVATVGVATQLVEPAPAGAVAFALATAVVFQIQQFVFRSRLAFGSASLQQGMMGVGLLVIAAALITSGAATFVVAALGYATVQGVAIASGIVLDRPPVGRFSAVAFRRLVSIGFPIMVVGVLFSVFITADRWVATTVLGPADAAPYALASVIGSALLVLPSVISQHTYPRMAVMLGQSNDPGRAYEMASQQNRFALLTTVPVAVIVAVGAVALIPALFSAYAGAVGPTIVLCAGLVALSAFSGYGNFLNVMNAQWTYLRVQAASLAGAIVAMVGGALSLGLIGIGLGAAGAYLVYGILLARAAASVRNRAEAAPWR
jgi:O-antigen/teichoic acid export membrane protein